jgi:MinD-like ATPase involved in chromosome partitioning or flagellar assembly
MPIISIIGTKGGVGKSTVAMNVSAWLSRLQEEMVLLVDGDTHVRTVELKMCPNADVTLADVMAGKHSLADAIYRCQLVSGGRPMFPRLAVLPAGGRFLPPGGRDIVSFVENTVERFERMLDTLRKRFSYIIVDTPASVSFEHLILTAIADALLYVVNPDVDSILSASQTAAGLKELMGIEGVGVVVNRVPRGGADDLVRQAELVGPLLGVVPDDELVEDSFRRDLPVIAMYPDSPASQALKEIAGELMKKRIPATRLMPKFKFAQGTR